MSAGIDYGLGTTNIDTVTGIRYGVISQRSVFQTWCDESEPVYPEYDQSESDEGCDCEPSGYEYNDDGYHLIDCLDSEIMVIKSPYFTYARFCSPCCPGAGDLNNADTSGVKTYCLGHNWFDEGKAPYPVYGVQDGSLVEPV